MTDLILTTFDWVPDPPRGYVRDLRVRWALEEAGLPYHGVPEGACRPDGPFCRGGCGLMHGHLIRLPPG